MRGDLERVSEQDMRLSPACAEYARELLPVSRPKRHVVYEAKEMRDHHREPAIVQEAALRPGTTMAVPVREMMQGEPEILINELSVQPLKIGICRIALLRHLDEPLTKLFRGHADRNDIGSVFVACIIIMQPPLLFQSIMKRRRRDGVEHAYQRRGDVRLGEEFRHHIE